MLITHEHQAVTGRQWYPDCADPVPDVPPPSPCPAPPPPLSVSPVYGPEAEEVAALAMVAPLWRRYEYGSTTWWIRSR